MSACVDYILFVLSEQVSFVQFSDDAKTEFKLNTYHDKGIVISALQTVRYRGGNTKTGTAQKKAKWHLSKHIVLKKMKYSDSVFSVFYPLCRRCYEARL